MRTRRALSSCLAAIALLGACVPGPTGTGGTPRPTTRTAAPKADGAPGAAPTPGLGPVASQATPTAPPLAPGALPAVGGPAAGIVSNNGAGIGGVVRAPASLISDLGGGVVSNNGAGLGAPGAGGYRLAAQVEQVPLAGRTVRLLDGAGQPVLAEGRPVTAVTDAQGRYAFAIAAGARAWMVRVDLDGEKGRLLALVPPTDAARAVDVDLVSTLVGSYILTTYVEAQPDRQATLDRLPADVEAETRAIAAKAFFGGGEAVPADLTPARVAETVGALRRADAGFDAQMEAVRRLLIPAGRSDFGAGLPGTEVELFDVGRLVRAADGALVFNSINRGNPAQSRLWRLGQDGRLTKVVDGNACDLALDPQGRPVWLTVDEVDRTAFDFMFGGAFGSLGRLGPAHPARLEPDGAVTALLPELPAGRGMLPGPDGRLHLLAGQRQDPLGLVSLATGAAGAPAAVPPTVALPAEVGGLLARASAHALAPDGAILVLVGRPEEGGQALYRFDPDAKTLTKVDDAAGLGARALALAATGELFVWRRQSGLAVRSPAGQETTLLADPPADFALTEPAGVALGPGGEAWLVRGGKQVVRLAGGVLTPVAGLSGAGGLATTAATLDLKEPAGAALDADGALVVADMADHRLYRYPAAGGVAVLAGTGTPGLSGDGGPAAQATLHAPRDLQADARGGLYFLDQPGEGQPRIRHIAAGPDRTITTRFVDAATRIQAFAVAPDGTLYALAHVQVAAGEEARLVSIAADGGVTTLLAADPGLLNVAAIALDAKGVLLLSRWTVRRWTPAGGMQVLKAFPAKVFMVTFPFEEISLVVDGQDLKTYPNGLAADRRGRLYLTVPGGVLTHQGSPNAIVRWDPADDSTHVVAGPGGGTFAGTSVDDSLDRPERPLFDPAGNLLVTDANHKQIKRIPAERL